jgi:hypothetical protein
LSFATLEEGANVNKRLRRTLARGISLLVPLSILLAHRQARGMEEERVLGYAQSLLQRSTGVAEQAYDASERLGAGTPIHTDRPHARSADGVLLYAQARLPLVPGMSFSILERHDHAAMTHETLQLDADGPSEQVALGITRCAA